MINEHEFWLKELERAKAIGTPEEIIEAERELRRITKEKQRIHNISEALKEVTGGIT